MLSTTLMCGNSSKCWKTMPIWARRRVRLVFGSPTEMPLTSTSPRWNGSSPLTVLIKVLLPEPEGPHTTTTSPLFTAAEQSFSTCTGPYHLLTSFISIIAMTAPSRSRALPARNRQPELEPLHEARQAEADREIDDRDEQVHLDQAAVPLGDLRGGAEEIGDREHVDERGVLEQDDGLREQYRQHVPERLREHDLPHRLPVGEAERIPGPHLAARDRLDPGPHDLAVVGGLEHHEGNQRGQERPDLDRARRAEQPAADPGHEEVEPEDHEHERRRAHDVHVGAGYGGKRAVARQPHHRQQGPEDDPADHGQRGEREREGHALPEHVGCGAPDDVPVEAGEHVQCPACGIAVPGPISPGTASRFSSQRIRITTSRLRTM